MRAALRERGLLNGYVTVDNFDWAIDDLARKAVEAGTEIDLPALGALYVETIVDTANFNDRVARETLGRSPAHVLLLHETDLNALFVADLVAGLRAAGWTIVTMDEAYADPIARDDMRHGRFVELNDWRRDHIWSQASFYSTPELLERATGEPLNAQHFADHLRRRYLA